MKISVITAVYNNRKTISQALDSILQQSHPSIELIVIDGGSDDGTFAILDSYRTRLGRLVSEPDEGIYDALNKGISLATGDVIGFLHSDDIYENGNVLSKVATAFQNQSIDAIYGDLVYASQDDVTKVIRYWRAGYFDHFALACGWMPPHPTFFVRRSVYERLGTFDAHYQIAADYDLILRFLTLGKIQMVYLPEVLVRMRIGGISNRSIKTIIQKSLEDLEIVRHYKVGGILTLAMKNLRKISQFWLR